MDEISEKDVTEAIAVGLKRLREERGLSQREVLYDTGTHIARIEARITGMSIYTLKKMCQYYGVSLKEFFSTYCDL